MTAGSPLGAGRDEQVRVEELRQREITRRLALRQARSQGRTIEEAPQPQGAEAVGGPASVVPPRRRPEPEPAVPQPVPEGFADRQAWEHARSFAELMLPDSLKTETGTLCAQGLARATTEAAARQDDPVEGVSLLVMAQNHELDVFDDRLDDRARALLEDRPLPLPGELGSMWQVYQDDRRLTETNLPAPRQRVLLAKLPLPLLDDYIDEEWIGALPEHNGTSRAAYLRARLDPASLTEEEMGLLAWSLERERREAGPGTEPGRDWPQDWRLLVRLQAHDASAVTEEWTDLLPPTQKLLDALREVRRTGEVPDGLLADERLWSLLERIHPGACSTTDKRFNGWVGVRALVRTVRQMHRALLHGDEETVEQCRRTALTMAARLRHHSQPVRWEAQNVQAYLRAGREAAESLKLLEQDAEGRPPVREQLGGGAVAALRKNRSFLGSRPSGERDQPLNPYLVLGVPDGAGDWKKAWRALRKELDDSGRVRINHAKDMIEKAERERQEAPRFAVPLAPHRWSDPAGTSHRLELPPEPLQRLTEPPTDSDRAWSRTEAAREIITRATERLFPAAESPAALEDPESSTS
ncbi:hypothetical protein M4914_22065 [Streptomyces somaliensis DSM 40738]|uniref:Uncharacterized protein n=1 Tax=Streptomyces somaliensis (strain ATCC 33201 / DSM 40738 / JCM 12659 / KCTC 9044 / NCTC 11332 / NRRL B-12077 / IP 733) TaxID=1134445 RepID=A0AA44DC87_STRE0|nr:hypothetical protein [Streptomyces somaliensis]MCQ0025354.1 hypothetical protein [Streptomyces somaliensis DSM 40738]NKY13556.1 hypothetical protein [Streptomyces somaliensis DSM 40738]